MPEFEEILALAARCPRPPGYTLPGGATAEQLRMLEESTGLELPQDVARWFRLCNGAMLGHGGLYGIDADDPTLDIYAVLSFYDSYPLNGWLPIAGDGFGNHYVVRCSGEEVAPAGVVLFVETMSPSSAEYAVASSVRHFLYGLLSRELGERWWPYDEEKVLERDPSLSRAANLGLPWER